MNYGVRKCILDIEKSSYAKEDYLPVDLSSYIDCSSGINPFGCSDEVKERLNKLSWEDVNCYPESSMDIKQCIAQYWEEVVDLNKSQIFLGDGSIGIIYRINKLFLEKGSKVLGYSPQFTDYIDDVKSYGGKYECYLLNGKNNFRFNLELFLNKMDRSHNLFYLDNPNNPTGQIIDMQSIEQILKKAKSLNRPVIIDEAYGDFMTLSQSAISLINNYDNLFVIRTFSKGLGLAGLRAGYLITSRNFGKYYTLISNPYEMNAVARYLAIYAMKDFNFIKKSNEGIRRGKKKLIDSLKVFYPLNTDLSVPIMTIKHPDSQVDLEKYLLGHGILSVSGEGFIGLDKSYVRVRMPNDIERLIGKFKDIEKQIEKQ